MKTIKAWVTTKKGNDFELNLPAKRIMCDRCDGTGHHDHEAFSNGVSEENLQDPDFSESYRAGHYDVRCSVCNGEKVILVVDETRMSAKMIERYYRSLDEKYRNEQEAYYEQRAGC